MPSGGGLGGSSTGGGDGLIVGLVGGGVKGGKGLASPPRALSAFAEPPSPKASEPEGYGGPAAERERPAGMQRHARPTVTAQGILLLLYHAVSRGGARKVGNCWGFMVAGLGGIARCSGGQEAARLRQQATEATRTDSSSASGGLRMTRGGAQRPRPTCGCAARRWVQLGGGGVPSPFRCLPLPGGGGGRFRA